MKEWMAQADPPKEASTFARMNSRPQLFFSNKMTHYFIDWMTPSGLLKKNILQIIFLTVAVPKNYSTRKKQSLFKRYGTWSTTFSTNP